MVHELCMGEFALQQNSVDLRLAQALPGYRKWVVGIRPVLDSRVTEEVGRISSTHIRIHQYTYTRTTRTYTKSERGWDMMERTVRAEYIRNGIPCGGFLDGRH